jgi:hypothetical protein
LVNIVREEKNNMKINMYLFRELIDSLRVSFANFDEITDIGFGTIHFHAVDSYGMYETINIIMKDDDSFSVEKVYEYPHDEYKHSIIYEGNDIVEINKLIVYHRSWF